MKYEELNQKNINEMCEWLEFYDLNGYFPFDNWLVRLWRKII